MTKIEKLVSVLRKNHVYIQMHNFPDPDAIASAFGLKELLEHYDKEVTIVFDGSIDRISCKHMLRNFRIPITSVHQRNNTKEDDEIILVDCQHDAKNVTDFAGTEIAAIDHHPATSEYEYRYKDVRMVGACSSMVALYYEEADITPSRDVATALLYGIKMDTDNFNRGVRRFDIEMYVFLFEYADSTLVQRMMLNTMQLTDLDAYKMAISDITIIEDFGLACVPMECPDGLVAMISDFILALNEVNVSVVYTMRENGYKFSARSEVEDIDAGVLLHTVLSTFGGSGGGHDFMAGGFIPINQHDGDALISREEIEAAFKLCLFPKRLTKLVKE